MKTASRISFWIVVCALLLYAVTTLLPNNPGNLDSYVGCTYDFKGGVQCYNFVGSNLAEYLLGVGTLFMFAPTLGWILFVFAKPSLLAMIALLIMAIEILAVAYVIGLIKNVFHRTTDTAIEGNAWEFKVAKILIIILLITAAGWAAIFYALDPLGLRTPLTVSETTGKAPLTVHITGPSKVLALKDMPYELDNSFYPKHDCGFSIMWTEFDADGTARNIIIDSKEGSCAILLSHTFTEPGRYMVQAYIPSPKRKQIVDDLADGADYNIWTSIMLDSIWSGDWYSQKIDIHVE